MDVHMNKKYYYVGWDLLAHVRLLCPNSWHNEHLRLLSKPSVLLLKRSIFGLPAGLRPRGGRRCCGIKSLATIGSTATEYKSCKVSTV